jgi:hypothetical protein
MTKNTLAIALAIVAVVSMPVADANDHQPVNQQSRKIQDVSKQDKAKEVNAAPAMSLIGMLIVCLAVAR